MDRYNERLVVGRAGKGAYLVSCISVLAILFGAFTLLFVDAGLGLLFIVGGIAALVMGRELYSVEFEYIITNGDIDIAKITAKKSRKQLKAIRADQLISLDSLSDPRVKNDLEVKKDIVIRDFTKKDKNATTYYVVQSKEEGKTVYNILDLDEKSVDNIRYALKHKISGAPVRIEK